MSRTDPIAVFKFGLEIEGIITGWFTECSGLSMEREVFEHKEGGLNEYVHKLPDRTKYSNITLKRGIAGDEIWDWYQKGLHTGQVERHNVSIILYNRDGSKAKRWNLREAYPVKWAGPSFKVDSNEVAIETLEIVHHGLDMTGWTDT